MSRDPDFSADLRALSPARVCAEQSIWAIATYRFGRRIDRLEPGPWRTLLTRIYWIKFRFIETVTGISLPKEAQIGPGLRIYHFGNIFVHSDAKIGANCTIRQGVTIGNRAINGPAPVVEDDVEFGAYVQVLGAIRIGRVRQNRRDERRAGRRARRRNRRGDSRADHFRQAGWNPSMTTPTGASRWPLAYVAGIFPLLSETFVYREVRGLRSAVGRWWPLVCTKRVRQVLTIRI